eukprot:TRINITY_DN2974_c0_g1_i2.p2 TRINITY_DN2974_c0_g1~~TRINITY_DN2974_c0_g1_i2.p2  ORF type:complete len:302 (-),score=91.87 TRINITY_DN2974_c0_g1_i2:1268-2173(-)
MAVAAIGAKLDDIERRCGVSVVLAVEAGSRAWGLDSPSSDYDVKFIYVHEVRHYLSVSPARKDTITEQCTHGGYEIDLAGWDIKKALELCRRSNGSLLEWLRSAVVYREVAWPADEATAAATGAATLVQALRSVAFRHCSSRSVGWHYHSNARNDVEACLMKGDVDRPSYLYVIRPVACLRWLLDRDPHSDLPSLPPLSLEGILPHIKMSEEVAREVASLVAAKRKTPGATEAQRQARPRVMCVDEWLRTSLEEWRKSADAVSHADEPSWETLDALMFQFVSRGTSNAADSRNHNKVLTCL